jgi:NTE family protein
MTTALVLSGGGARGAYQVGVLKALTEILPAHVYNPFPIVCGTSAGAINTLTLAGRPGSFGNRVADLEAMWRSLTADKIYRTDIKGVSANALKLFCTLFRGNAGLTNPVALLDNRPLRHLLSNFIQFREIDESIASGYLKAVAITAMSYGSGQSITFFQGDHDNWQRFRRLGLRTGLTIEHLMASSAIPTMFPPVKVGNRYYGDGALRQLKPLSPALHLGADRLFVIGVSDNLLHRQVVETNYHPPTLAQMIGHMLNSAFIDTIESDLETLRLVNEMADRGGCEQALGGSDKRKIDYICITPSVAINQLAENYLHELPRTVKTFLRFTGATARGGGTSAASYLLFEPGFCGELINMGYRDTFKQEHAVLAFFSL